MLLSENPINSTTISLTRVNKSKYVYQIIKIDVQQTVLEGYESRVPKRGADERHGNSLRDSNRACMGNHPIIDTGFFFYQKNITDTKWLYYKHNGANLFVSFFFLTDYHRGREREPVVRPTGKQERRITILFD